MTTLAASSDNISIACQQILQQDGSVFSIQWLDLPPDLAAGLSPDLLLPKYLEHIRRITGTLVRPAQFGKQLEFRFWRSQLSLLDFEIGTATATDLELRIRGGILVQPTFRRKGELVFSCVPQDHATAVGLCLSGYFPRLLGSPAPGPIAKWGYRLTQAAIHKFVTVRFLVRLLREQAGGQKVAYRVVQIQDHDGESI